MNKHPVVNTYFCRRLQLKIVNLLYRPFYYKLLFNVTCPDDSHQILLVEFHTILVIRLTWNLAYLCEFDNNTKTGIDIMVVQPESSQQEGTP